MAIPTRFWARRATVWTPAPVVAGVPLKTAPLPEATNVSPLGKPDARRLGTGAPTTEMVNGAMGTPAVTVTAGTAVIPGAWRTVTDSVAVTGGPTPLLATTEIGYVPPVPPTGVPTRAAVPAPTLARVRPGGSAEAVDIPGTGRPREVATTTLRATPTVALRVLLVRRIGTASIVSTKCCVTVASALAAVMTTTWVPDSRRLAIPDIVAEQFA